MFSLFKKRKCEVCSNHQAKKYGIPELNDPTEMKYIKKILCINHLFEEFKKHFLAHPYKMIITSPIIKNEKYDLFYSYFSIKELERFDFKKEEIIFVKDLLNKIPEDKECAYIHLDESRLSEMFNKKTREPNTFVAQPSKLVFDEIEYISKNEAWNKIKDTLYNNESTSGQGINMPYGKEGIFLSGG